MQVHSYYYLDFFVREAATRFGVTPTMVRFMTSREIVGALRSMSVDAAFLRARECVMT